MSGIQRAQRLTRGDGSAGPDAREHRLVRRAQPARVVDADHAAARHAPGERHDARPGRPDVLTGRAGQVYAAVAR